MTGLAFLPAGPALPTRPALPTGPVRSAGLHRGPRRQGAEAPSTGPRRRRTAHPYRGGMNSLTLGVASQELDSGITAVPTAVPTSWKGGASTACQGSLDDVVALLAGLTTRMEAAMASVGAVNDGAEQCTVIP